MKLHPRILAVAVAVFTLVFAGCSGGDSHEKLADDMAKQMDRIAGAMGSITDKATAESAVAEMKSVVGEMKKIADRAKALGKPSAELNAKLEAKMKAKEVEIQQKMAGSQASLIKAGPEAAGIIMKGMMELGPTLEEIGKVFQDADKK